MSILLTDEEVRQALREANDKAQDYGDDLQPLPERNVARNQAKKIFDMAREAGLFDVHEDGYIYNCPNLTASEFWSSLQKEIEGK